MTAPDHRAIERMLWPKGRTRNAWMIVDAARDRRIYALLLDCFYTDRICLFGDGLVPALEIASPYLVRLEYESAKTQRFLAGVAGKQWGIYLKCDESTDDLRRHLRELLIVRHPKGHSMVFRYYDPRVFRAFLPTCSPEELRTVFGKIDCFWFEDDEPGMMINAAIDKRQLVLERVPLPSA
jgi:hypothetical protein